MPTKPPGPWFEGMSEKVRSGNPDYSDEQIRKTVGDIWYNKMSPSKKKEETKKSEGSLKKQASKDAIVEGFADALFKSSWATFEEEEGTSFSGMDILDVAPDTPPEVVDFAETKVSEIEAKNSISFDSYTPPGETGGSFDPWELGWYIGMQWLGHGVSWADDHEELGIDIPYGEFGIHDVNPDGTYDFYPLSDKQESSEECTCGGPGKGFSMGRKDFVTCKDCGKPKSPDWKGDFERTGDHDMTSQKRAFGENEIDPKGMPQEKTFKVKFSEAVWEVLYSGYKEGGDEALAALLSRTANGLETDATLDEVMSAHEDLTLALVEEIDPVIGDEITNALMRLDDILVSNAAEGAIGELDKTFPSNPPGSPPPSPPPGGPPAKAGTTKNAVGFPNMLSNDTKKWIQLQTTNLAAKKGAPATPEQAHAYIDEAAVAVAQELANAIGPEVKKVVDEFREKIFQDITAGVELAAPNAKPATPPVVPPSPVSEETAPVQPPGASLRKAKMSQDLKRAFDNSYAYDALALVLDAELGPDFTKKITADEVIDEEEAILDLAQQDFPNVSRKDLVNAFGELLTDAYAKDR